MQGDSYEEIEPSLLLCPRCRVAMPVRKRLLLFLPGGRKFDYSCTRCGESCGDKWVPDHGASR